MRHAMSVTRPLVALAFGAAAALVPTTARGQLAVQTANTTALILPPMPDNPGDSTYAVQVGDAIRKKIDGKLRLKLRVVPKDRMAEALGNSGFSPDAILDDNGAIQLARFMNVDAYLWGTLSRTDNVPSLHLRLVDNRRSGLSGWVTVKGVPGKDVDDFASLVADSVDVQVKAAEQARECLDRRDKKEFGSAEDRAARAFRIAPNHPAAALCLAAVLEIKKASIDSQIAVYQRAAEGDPDLARAWDGLSRLYQQKGDSAAWADALIKNLETNPTDMRLRFAAVELLYRTKQYARSVQLLDQGLERSPGDNGATSLKARSCFDGQLWACAVSSLGARFNQDTSLQRDSLYIMKVMVAAGAVNDSAMVAAQPEWARPYYRTTSDNQAMEKWTGIAVEKFPNSVTFWKRRAAALQVNGKADEALAALRRVAQLDPQDFASRLQIGNVLSERAGAAFDSLGRIVDSLTKADTMRLKQVRPTWDAVVANRWAQVDSALSDAQRLATPETRVNVGALIFQPATKLVQKQIAPVVAIAMLERALPLMAGNAQLVNQANFFLGLAYLYKVQGMDLNGAIKNKDCAVMNDLETTVSRGKAAITAGASVQPATAQQLVTVFGNLEKTPPQAKKAWNCK